MLTRLTLLAAAIFVIAAVSIAFTPGGVLGGDNGAPEVTTVETESAVDRRIAELQAKAAANPEDTPALSQLGFAYLQKSRENGDTSLYARSETAFLQVLDVQPNDQIAKVGLGAIALARHEFNEALAHASEAIALDPEDADAWAIAGDALMELGRYDEAVQAFQQMVDLRPDHAAFVRIAYARELHGDVDGARMALEDAVESAGPTGENAAYARVQLGNIMFGRGDLDGAKAQYEAALQAYPGYVHALARVARVDAAQGEYDRAIELYEQVTARQPVLEYVVALGDTYALAGDEASAKRQYSLVEAIDELYRANGIDTELELALYYADHDLKTEEAVRQAQTVYEQRPSVPAADALAWALYKDSRPEEALPYAQEALALGTRDAGLYYHLGMIQKSRGDDDASRTALEEALAINPYFSLLQAPIARRALEEVGQ